MRSRENRSPPTARLLPQTVRAVIVKRPGMPFTVPYTPGPYTVVDGGEAHICVAATANQRVLGGALGDGLNLKRLGILSKGSHVVDQAVEGAHVIVGRQIWVLKIFVGLTADHEGVRSQHPRPALWELRVVAVGVTIRVEAEAIDTLELTARLEHVVIGAGVAYRHEPPPATGHNNLKAALTDDCFVPKHAVHEDVGVKAIVADRNVVPGAGHDPGLPAGVADVLLTGLADASSVGSWRDGDAYAALVQPQDERSVPRRNDCLGLVHVVGIDPGGHRADTPGQNGCVLAAPIDHLSVIQS
eukprot:scaffold113530_cov47-Prasinocladus_malaysianus.AAC.1